MRQRNILILQRLQLRMQGKFQPYNAPQRDPDVAPFWRQHPVRRAMLVRHLYGNQRRAALRDAAARQRLRQELLPPRAAPRRWLVRPWHAARWRFGAWNTIIPTMLNGDEEMFFNFLRMTVRTFNELLAQLGPHLQRRPVRGYLSPGERLALTLRYLASGQDMKSTAYTFAVAPSTTSTIIRTTCETIWTVMEREVFPVRTPELWERVAGEFQQQWDFPNCIGALDGKHCVVQNFPRAAADYFNYKETYSIVLLGLADARYRFLWVDVGGRGRRSDGGLWNRTGLATALRTGAEPLPPRKALPGGWPSTPHVIVGDAAFALGPHLMTPYSGRFLTDDKNIYNYRLSRARRVVENTFGIMTARFRILRKTLVASRPTAVAIVKAVVVLHNLLVTSEENLPPAQQQYKAHLDREEQDGSLIPGRWREEVGDDGLEDEGNPINVNGAENGEAAEVRELLTDWFLGPGALPWQWGHAIHPQV